MLEVEKSSLSTPSQKIVYSKQQNQLSKSFSRPGNFPDINDIIEN